MDKTLTPTEEALLEKLVYVLSILEEMGKRIKALESGLIEETSTTHMLTSRHAKRIAKLENQVNGDGK